MSPDAAVRVRFAPSPTGRLHIGGARAALFNWAFARRHGGTFVLRVEDTDEERNTAEALGSIFSSLRWLGLDWDEGPEKGGDHGPYFQSERKALYGAAAEQLLAGGHLYRCFCTPARIRELKDGQSARKENPHYDQLCRKLDPAEAARRAAAGEPCTLRFAVPAEGEILIDDLVRGEVRFAAAEVEDWVAVRTTGVPTYNFGCVVDDAGMGITHVLRGEEHLVNTPKQLLLFQALGAAPPRYAHLPLILGQDGKKLSKRTGDTATEDYRDKGYPPEALFNFLARLGFSIDDKTEVFTPEDLVAAFDLKRVTPSGAIFDPDKLHWLCGEYLRRTPEPELLARVLPWLRTAGLVQGEPAGAERDWLQRAVASVRERSSLYAEVPEKIAYLFGAAVEPDAKAAQALEGPEPAARLEEAAAALEAAPEFPPADFDAWVKELAAAAGAKPVTFLKPMRAALAGTLGGPAVGEILALLGKERALARMRAPAAARH